jgi:hypothetical protein
MGGIPGFPCYTNVYHGFYIEFSHIVNGFLINDKSNISIYMLLKYSIFIFIIVIYKINEYYILKINILKI